MAQFIHSFNLLSKLEFNSASNILHKNATEDDITFYGIYRKAHPEWTGWNIVDEVLSTQVHMKEASAELSINTPLLNKVKQFYKTNYWDKCKLDKVDSQKIADEIFCFAVNVGIKKAVKVAQQLCGAYVDGIIGKNTIALLNACNEDEFDIKFDEMEKKYYDELIEKRASLDIYKKGWYNRAEQV